MQPYQQASEEHTQQSVRPFEAAGSIAGVGLKGAIGKRVMSMLNKYVPASLAIKGLNKIDPRLGKFMSLGQESGHSVEDLSSFIGEKLGNDESSVQNSKEPAKQDRNIIEQYSPELHHFIMEEVKNGRSPIEAGALASLGKKGQKDFKSIISKITKDHNTPWSSILESVYGPSQQQQSQGQPQAPQQQTQPGQPNQGAQGGPGQQALMGILDKINQKLGQ